MQDIRLEYIQSSKPQQNAYVERYNRTVRYDWLSQHIFESISEVQEAATCWLSTYNHDRSNMAIGGITPQAEADGRLAPLLDSVTNGGITPAHRCMEHRERTGELQQMRLRYGPDLGPHQRPQDPLLPLPRCRWMAPLEQTSVRKPSDAPKPALSAGVV